MANTKYYNVIRQAQASQKPAPQLPVFDRERARTKGFAAKLVTRFLENPRWALALLRRFKPNVKLGPFVLVTKNADVREVLERQDVFETPFALEMTELAGGSNFVLGMSDGPAYRRMKSSILTAFPPAEAEQRIRPIAARHSREIMREAFPGIDVAGRLLRVVPARICREYYGMLIDDEAEFTDWAIALSGLFFADFFGSPVTRELAVAAGAKMSEAVDLSLAAVRDGRIAADTPLARLLAIHDATPETLSMQDIRSVMLGMISGFVPTNILAAGNALDVLLSKSEARAAVEAAVKAGDDAALDRAVMEAMRFKPINIGPMRVCNEDTVIARGTPREYAIKAGTTVWPSTFSAMFDPEAVQDPETYNPDRPARDSMVFGHGIHWCIGSAIARIQIAEAFKAVFSNVNVRRMDGARGRLTRLGAFPEHLCVWYDRPGSSKLTPHAMVTAVAPVTPGTDLAAARAALAGLGNPAAPEIETAFRKSGIIHFCSVAIACTTDAASETAADPAHVVFELSGDGTEADVIAAFVAGAGGHLRPVLEMAAGLAPGADLAAWISRHAIGIGPAGRMGLPFSGTPGHSVKRIGEEDRLQQAARAALESIPPGASRNPLSTLRTVRRLLQESGDHDAALTPAASLLENVKGGGLKGVLKRVAEDPWVQIGAVMIFLAGLWANMEFLSPDYRLDGFLPLAGLFGVLLLTIAEIVLVLGILAGVLALLLQLKENRDPVTDAQPDAARFDAFARNENKAAQNNLTAISRVKPGFLRWLALRAVFVVIALAGRYAFRPGYLADINTIHFARWARIPGTDRLMFFSNYGGSWESYLEDFITKANYGLTGVWSNTLGFPRARFLFGRGAADGDRFKRWARLQQIPTLFWYSAYPHLNTRRIRINSAIRQGLCEGRTDDDARLWLAQFGSLRRPEDRIETDEVQSLFFGPLGKLPFGRMIALRIPEAMTAANRKAWLESLRADLAFGDAMPAETAMIAAFTPAGFQRLGMRFNSSHDPLESFPLAFRQGMQHETRARILGDNGPNGPENWRWGNEANSADAVVLLYARDEKAAKIQADGFLRHTKALGIEKAADIPLSVKTEKFGRAKEAGVEPFGFADGISQPVVRGTPRANFAAADQHLVAAGEFLHGYRDERGNFPPAVALPGGLDSAGYLPLARSEPPRSAGRDFARNGSFLVVRQLQQHVERFRDFCSEAAEQANARPGAKGGATAEWIGAKMVGRWKDGSSLVRNPHGAAGRPIDNDFAYGAEDPQGLNCPLGSHVRRTNPRDSLGEDRDRQTGLAKRHKILRVGRAYALPAGKKNAASEQGLVFMCLNADLERQFEFMQQTWVSASLFHGLDAEQDPLLGASGGRYTIPSVNGNITLTGLGDFVSMRGGGYFFMPGKRSIDYMISRL